MKRFLTGILFLSVLVTLSGCRYETYNTTDIDNYGIIKGNIDNGAVENLFEEMFPETIENQFENVVYSYHAEEGDTISCEIFLSFQIRDTEEFEAYVKTIGAGKEKRPFPYDEAWIEYEISNVFDISKGYAGTYYCIDYADVRLILVNPQEQTVVFSLIRVLDGGGTRVSDISVFFQTFGIDPVEYASLAG